jgi:hypothetical protein
MICVSLLVLFSVAIPICILQFLFYLTDLCVSLLWMVLFSVAIPVCILQFLLHLNDLRVLALDGLVQCCHLPDQRVQLLGMGQPGLLQLLSLL